MTWQHSHLKTMTLFFFTVHLNLHAIGIIPQHYDLDWFILFIKGRKMEWHVAIYFISFIKRGKYPFGFPFNLLSSNSIYILMASLHLKVYSMQSRQSPTWCYLSDGLWLVIKVMKAVGGIFIMYSTFPQIIFCLFWIWSLMYIFLLLLLQYCTYQWVSAKKM